MLFACILTQCTYICVKQIYKLLQSNILIKQAEHDTSKKQAEEWLEGGHAEGTMFPGRNRTYFYFPAESDECQHEAYPPWLSVTEKRGEEEGAALWKLEKLEA